MEILSGADVDVITPFPQGFLGHAAGWMYGHKSFLFGDGAPQDLVELEHWLAQRANLPFVQTFGIIDKHNLTGSSVCDAPLVGIVFFERDSEVNGYFHVASRKLVWGERLAKPGLTQQAITLIIPWIFEHSPELQRVSAACFENNRAAQGLIKKLGFQQDGFFRAMGKLKGSPITVVHYGLLRPEPEAPENIEVTNGLGK